MSRRRRSRGHRRVRNTDGSTTTYRRDSISTRPRWRDLSDFFDPHSVLQPKGWRSNGPMLPDQGIPHDNWLQIFGRYRDTNHSNDQALYGLDFTGKRLEASSKLGEFYSLILEGPGKGNHNNLVINTVGGTLPGGRSSDRTQTWDSLNPGPPYRTGKPFFSVRSQLPSSQTFGGGTYFGPEFISGLQKIKKCYQGKFLDNGVWGPETLTLYNTGKPSPRVLASYGTQAWDRLKPQVEKVNAGQFLYELKDLPRQLATSANLLHNSWRSFGGGYSTTVMHPRSVADNFLNHEFGWVPFISDLRQIINLYQNSRDYMIRAVRDNDRWKRRERVLEDKETMSQVYKFYGSLTSPGNGNFRIDDLCIPQTIDGVSCKGFTEIWVREFSQTWACGSFKFYRPEFDDKLIGFESQLMNVQRLLTLYGIRINPSTLWRITPWTWLVDWFVHIGDLISFWDQYINDGILSRYLYVMQRVTRTAQKRCSIFFSSGTLTMEWIRSFQSKRRESADSPYGFNRPWSNLTPRQWAIIGAVGYGRT